MKKLSNSIAFKSIAGIVALLIVFSAILGIIGNVEYSRALMEQYAEGAFYTADAASLAVKPDHLQIYLNNGGTGEEFDNAQSMLSKLCDSQGAAFIYVIQPDLTDYAHITFVLVGVNSDNTYPVYSCGYVRETTNEEYHRKYRALYEEKSDRELVIRDKGYIETDPHITAMIPLIGADGKTKGILCVQRQMDRVASTRKSYLIKIFLVMFLSMILAAINLGLYQSRVLLNPLKIIIKEASRFSTENVKAEKKLTQVIRNRDEIGELARAIDEMEDQITGYVDHLTRITAEEEKIRTELSLAARIQAAMLPDVFPPFPERKEFDLYALMDPARDVGGDFYDFFLIDNDHLCLVIADVSGKGIPGALFMTISKVIVENTVMNGNGPAQVLESVNEIICAHNREEMFVTVWLGILEISTGKLTAANAGHEYPAVTKPGGCFELIKDPHSFVIGGMDGVKYKEYELQIEPGSRLFVYTDGVPEAADSNDRQFGTQRMLEALNENPAASAKEIICSVRLAVDRFTAEAEQFDDMTMLCLEYNGGSADLLDTSAGPASGSIIDPLTDPVTEAADPLNESSADYIADSSADSIAESSADSSADSISDPGTQVTDPLKDIATGLSINLSNEPAADSAENQLAGHFTDTENSAGNDCIADMAGGSRSTGGAGAEEKSVKELTLEATLENLHKVTDFIDGILEELECPMKAQIQIDVAIDELFSNIARYAYRKGIGKATVRLEEERDPRAVRITFIDQGVPYNPLEQKDPDITLAAEDRPIGGLGVFVVKKTMDDVRYEHRDGKNILSILKKI